MTYETLLVETRGAVTLVTLNRPQALNALNSGVLDDLIAAFAAFEADSGQRCAILTGSGDKAFAAGADIKEMADKPAADFYLEDFFSKWTSDFVKKVRKPWIAAVAVRDRLLSAARDPLGRRSPEVREAAVAALGGYAGRGARGERTMRRDAIGRLAAEFPYRAWTPGMGAVLDEF